MSETLNTKYEPALSQVRQDIVQHPALQALLSEQTSPELLERFLIEYCARGVQITEPVEGWIRRAGERCREVGLTATGDALIKHAVHEAGHQLMFVDDTRYLVSHWNQHYLPQLDADRLLAQGRTPGMHAYIELHEEVIAGSAPFGQVAIEYEIERLSVDVLPSLMQAFERKLGTGLMKGLSFLTEHAELDVGHTKLNRKMLGRLLDQRPESLAQLIDTGSRALHAYLRFFGDCLEIAQNEPSRRQSLAG